jgi:hypothetical protein
VRASAKSTFSDRDIDAVLQLGWMVMKQREPLP